MIAVITAVAVFITIVVVYYIGFMIGGVYSDNKTEDEIEELKKEIKWWKSQVKAIGIDRDKIKRELEEKGKKKLTIEKKYEKEIRYWFNEGLIDREIAEKIGCGKSTVQRAIKKWGLR